MNTTFGIYGEYFAPITQRPTMYVGSNCTFAKVELFLMGVLFAFDAVGGRRLHNFGGFLEEKYEKASERCNLVCEGYWECLLRTGHPQKNDIELIRQLGDDFREWAETGPELSRIG